jgi:hypothetical protein
MQLLSACKGNKADRPKTHGALKSGSLIVGFCTEGAFRTNQSGGFFQLVKPFTFLQDTKAHVQIISLALSSSSILLP